MDTDAAHTTTAAIQLAEEATTLLMTLVSVLEALAAAATLAAPLALICFA